jgi:hypothetical protein
MNERWAAGPVYPALVLESNGDAIDAHTFESIDLPA